MKRVGVVAVGVLALLAVPAPAHAECQTPTLPVVGCVLPSASPSPSPSPSPSEPTASPTRSTAPSPEVAVTSAPPVDVPVAPGLVALPAPEVPVFLAPAVPAPAPQPVVQPVVQPVSAPEAAPAAASPLAGTVAGAFALVVFGLLALPLLLGFLAGLRPSSGGTMTSTRPRLWTGLAVIGLAAVVGGIGWYRISGEPLLNRQIPFLASAGILVVLLSVLGGALIVAEQLKGDQQRIADLERAVTSLTEALSPLVEQPPRRESAALEAQLPPV